MTSFWTKSVLLFSCIPDVNLGMIKINLFSVRGTKSPRGLRGPAFIELLLCVRHFWASYQPCDVGDTIFLSSMRWKNCSCSQKLTNKREVKLRDSWLGALLSFLSAWMVNGQCANCQTLSFSKEGELLLQLLLSLEEKNKAGLYIRIQGQPQVFPPWHKIPPDSFFLGRLTFRPSQ